MAKELVLLAVTLLSYKMMQMITGIKITEEIGNFISWSLSFLSETSRHEYVKNRQEFSRMSMVQRRKSKKYKYYAFMNDLIICLHLAPFGITVEGLTIVALLVSAAGSLAITMLMRNIVMFILVWGILFVGILAFLYLISRLGARQRKKEILETLDILCAVMSDGVILAVKNSLHLIPWSLRPYFSKFLINVENLNKSLDESVNILNEDIGDLFDEFCDTVIAFEHDRAPGMEGLFSFIITDNAKAVLRDRKIERESSKVNKDFAATCSLLVITILYTCSTYDYVMAIYNTPLGQFLLIMYFLLGMIVFIFTQYLMAKPYVYKEK